MTNNVLSLNKRKSTASAPWYRHSHGGVEFSPDRGRDAGQPQDGASDAGANEGMAKIASIGSRMNPLLGPEPEDARLTGTTRSLYRRVMGLNVSAPQAVDPKTRKSQKNAAVPAASQARVA